MPMSLITTSSIQLTKTEYFKILTGNYFREKWWTLICVILVGSYAITRDNKESLDYFFIILSITFPFYIMLIHWRFANAKENRVALLGRSYRIEEDQIIEQLEDGTESQYKLKHVVKTYKTSDYIMLYLSKVTFLYLPKDAFKTEDDYGEAIYHIESKIEK